MRNSPFHPFYNISNLEHTNRSIYSIAFNQANLCFHFSAAPDTLATRNTIAHLPTRRMFKYLRARCAVNPFPRPGVSHPIWLLANISINTANQIKPKFLPINVRTRIARKRNWFPCSARFVDTTTAYAIAIPQIMNAIRPMPDVI